MLRSHHQCNIVRALANFNDITGNFMTYDLEIVDIGPIGFNVLDGYARATASPKPAAGSGTPNNSMAAPQLCSIKAFIVQISCFPYYTTHD